MSLDKLWGHIEDLSKPINLDSFHIRSLSGSRLFLWPGPNERIYDIYRLSITIDRQGCSYVPDPIDLTPFRPYVKASLSELKSAPEFLQIAALDALLPSIPTKIEPLQIVRCHKSPWEKSLWRAETVVHYTYQLLTRSGQRKHRIALIGYSDAIVSELVKMGITVDVFDLDPLVIGKILENSHTILHGDAFFSRLDTYNAVIVTGMSLANGTFWRLQDLCQKAGIFIIMYAQTGGHLGPVMVELGVDIFIGECSPFYYEDGLSEASIYVNPKYQLDLASGL